jgi:heavy metal translocating P-type ATPase
LLRLGLAIFLTMNVVVFTMELWSQDFYDDRSFESPFATHLEGLFRWASLLFALPVLPLLGGPLARGVWQALRRRAATTDLLILIGVAASYGYSVVSVLRGSGHIYFEVGCVVLVFLSLGRWLEAKGKRQTGQSLDALERLLPETVRRLVVDDDGAEREELVAREMACVGDVIRLLPGERLSLDGRVAGGRAAFDEQIVTGESRPSVKSLGDRVFSGAVNLDGDLRIQVTAAAGADTVSKLLDLVREARRSKGRHERLADRIAAWFVPAVCLLAVAAGVWHGVQEGLDRGLMIALAVALIACPCALGLATPMAVWTALGRAAEARVLFRSGAVLERLAGVDVACFDKTGTLTSGRPEVAALHLAGGESPSEVLPIARRLASGSTHSLSRAICEWEGGRPANSNAPFGGSDDAVDGRSALVDGIDHVQSHSGRGIAAYDHGQVMLACLGSPRWMVELGVTMPADLNDRLADDDVREAPLVCMAWGGTVRAVFVFREQLRSEAPAAIAACRGLGLDVLVLTGDRRDRAAALATELGVDALAEQLPEDKATAVRRVGAGSVAMIGDGVNDAPALASAEVGVALGCGADLSRDAAGVCLLGDSLMGVPWAVGLARQTVRIVRQNLFWAFAYNAAGIALAAAGRLNPVWAAAAMAVSSILVIGNSLRLRRYDLDECEAARTTGETADNPATEAGSEFLTGRERPVATAQEATAR